PGNVDVPCMKLILELAEDVPVRHLQYALVVDFDLSFAVHVVVHDHLLAAYDRHAPHFARIQPARVDIGRDAIGKLQAHEHDILDTGVQVPIPPGADLQRHLIKQE